MTLKTILILQSAYCLLGLIYNIISYALKKSGKKPLGPNSPMLGSIVLFCYFLFLIPAYFNLIEIYIGLMIVAMIVISNGGIIKHFTNYKKNSSLYSSFLACATAIGINIFGVFMAGYAIFALIS